MSATDFLPRREAVLVTWSSNFNNKINANPAAYGLTVAQAAEYNAKHNAFAAAYALATSPSTGRSQTVAKNTAVRQLRATARQLARIVRGAPDVSDVQRSTLGLTVKAPGGKSARLARPTSAPSLFIKPLEAGRVQMRLEATNEPTKRGKPTGVSAAAIFVHVGEVPPSDPSLWSMLDMTTRTKHIVALPSSAPQGAAIWLTARWLNPRHEPGPFARPVYTFAPCRLGAENANHAPEPTPSSDLALAA